MKALKIAALAGCLIAGPALAHDIQAYYAFARDDGIDANGLGVQGRVTLGARDQWRITGGYLYQKVSDLDLKLYTARAGFEYKSAQGGTLNGIVGAGVQHSRRENDSSGFEEDGDGYFAYLGSEGKVFFGKLGFITFDGETDILYSLGARYGLPYEEGDRFGVGLYAEVGGGLVAQTNTDGNGVAVNLGINFGF